MANNITALSRLHLRRGDRRGRRARAGRLLGRVVRALQDDRPDPRRDRHRAGRQAAHRQAQRRRQPRHRPALRRDEHPDDDRLQGRRTPTSDWWAPGARARSSRSSATTSRPSDNDDRPRRRAPARPVDALPIQVGDHGDAVRDLQQRLTATGVEVHANEARGTYGPATADAVRAFQSSRRLPRHRGLRSDDLGGPGRGRLPTRRPAALPAQPDDPRRRRGRAPACPRGARLRRRPGRRHLRSPHRAGRPRLPAQRRPPADGKCGQSVLASLARLGRRAEHSTNVAGVREREVLGPGRRCWPTCASSLGEAGGLDVLVDRHRPRAAGRLGGGVAVAPSAPVGAGGRGQRLQRRRLPRVSACRTARRARWPTTPPPASSRPAASALAGLVVEAWRELGDLAVDDRAAGRLTVLRETRMPAVVCQLRPAATSRRAHRRAGAGGPAGPRRVGPQPRRRLSQRPHRGRLVGPSLQTLM